jgi:hypothetical protein
MASHSSINIALSADTSGLNKNIKEAAKTVEQGGKRMQEAARQAGEAMANALGNMSIKDAIKEVSNAIDEQKAITLGYQKDLQGLRDKSASMSAADIKGQRALRKEIEAVKASIAGQKLGIADLIAEKKLLQTELAKEAMATKEAARATGEANKASRENKTINSATRASLNGLATSFSSVSSIIAIVADDNKALRQTLMATNAALNFSAAVMQVRDLSKEYGGLGNAAKDVKKWISANPYLVAAAAITAVAVAVAMYETEAEGAARIQGEVNNELNKAAEGAIATSIQLKTYLAIVNDTTQSENRRTGALNELKKAGIAVDDVNIHTSAGLKTLNDRTARSIELSIKKAIADKAASKIAEIEIEKLDKLDQIRREGGAWYQKMLERTLPGYMASVNAANDVITEAENKTKLYQNAFKNASFAVADLSKVVDNDTESQKAHNTSLKDSSKDAAKAAEEFKKLEAAVIGQKNTGKSLLAPVDPIVIESMDEVLKKMDEIPAAAEGAKVTPLFTDVIEEAPATVATTVEISDAFKAMADRNSDSFMQNSAALNAASVSAAEWSAKTQVAVSAVNAAFAELQMQTAENIGQFIADVATGEKDAGKNFGKNMLGAIASFMESLGKAMVTTAIFTQAFEDLLVANPAAAVVAGIGMLAGAAIVRNTLKAGPQVTAFADGGIVSGPTLGLMGEYPNAASNPEVIAPLDKLKGMIGEGRDGYIASTTIQGRDLAIVLERYNKDSKRG